MKIAVCVKAVPDAAAGRRIDPATKRLDRSGELAISDFDTYAVEEGLKLKEASGEGEVVVVSMGPEKAMDALRKALAMGADRAVLITDAALENADLYTRLEARSLELSRLSGRMVEQHEEERRRLSRELHDETAQVFTAVKMELGVLREKVQPEQADRLSHVLGLIDTGIRSIRNVTNDLRPSLLDDLGLLPALRSLVADFAQRSGISIELNAPAVMPPLSREAELALFRALQEGLSNVLRHADAGSVDVAISVGGDIVQLRVSDDGRGPPDLSPERLELAGHMGLAGMRERITALGGTVHFHGRANTGAQLEIVVPLHPSDGA